MVPECKPEWNREAITVFSRLPSLIAADKPCPQFQPSLVFGVLLEVLSILYHCASRSLDFALVSHFVLQKNWYVQTKAELPQEGILFHTQFTFMVILLIKKFDFQKAKATQYTTFKTDIIKVVLVFLISNFFTNKNS